MSFRNSIAWRIGVPLQDALKKQHLRRDLSFLKETWKMSGSDLEALRGEKLAKLIEHSFTNVKFYQRRMREKGLTPDDILTIDDLRKLPPLERSDVPELLQTINSVDRGVAKGTSSGTTGIPISYYKDGATQSMGKAGLYFGRMVNGWKPGDRTVNVWGNPKTVNTLWTKPSSRLNAFIQNEIRIAACNLSGEADMKNAIERIVSSRAQYISGYTNSIRSIASVLASSGVSLNLKKVFTTAETLLKQDRILIERHLGPVCDMYGCSEINGIAFQCPDCGLYHTIDPHVIVEYEQCENGYYSLLITDLDNMAMPFIRYRVGDLVEVNDVPGQCPSGTSWSSFRRVQGRVSNIIEVSGMYINPITYFGDSFGRLLFSVFEKHVPYQTIWDGKVFTTTLYSVTAPSKESMAVLNGEMEKRLFKFPAEHKFSFSSEKPEQTASGKSMFFINRAGV